MEGPVENKLQLVHELMKVRGLVKEHLHSYDHFLTSEIQSIARTNNEIRSTVDPEIYLRFKDLKVGEPSIKIDGTPRKLFPQSCRLTGMTYAAPIEAHIQYVSECDGEKKIVEKKDVVIGRMPVMLRSCCCVLYEKDETELTKLGECPLDPGGYFIVQGNEKIIDGDGLWAGCLEISRLDPLYNNIIKVILMQEQPLDGRIFTDIDNKGNFIASVTSNTGTLRSKTLMLMEKGKIYAQLSQFQEKLPVMVVMKAMGMESDFEVVSMIGGDDEHYVSLLFPSIEECAGYGVHTKKQALRFLEEKLRKPHHPSALQEMNNRAFIVLRDEFIAHVPVHNSNFHRKCAHTAFMVRRLLNAVLLGKGDDKDYIGNKKFELSGQLLSFLFKAVFNQMIANVRRNVDAFLSKPTRSRFFDFSKHIDTHTISFGLERALSTGNWSGKGFMLERKGVTQVLGRMSFIQAVGALTSIQTGFVKSRGATGPRALHPSHFGMLCPCDTPVGESCGLTKHLTLMACFTTAEEERPLLSLCYSLGVEDLEMLPGEPLHSQNSYLVMLNGVILGKHRMPERFANNMRRLRRRGWIGKFVSVFVDDNQRYVYISSDEGRVCRPLIVVDKGVSRVKPDHMQLLVDGVWTIDDFLENGLIEYIDVAEHNNTLIALHEDEAMATTTHLEIEPFTILGVCAGVIPFLDHNHALRNIYQCAIGKQAIGNIAYNQLFRMDSLLRILVYPQRPLLTTETIELIQYDKLGAGQNAVVALMSEGYGGGDAIVMNKSSVDRGFGRCIVMTKEGTTTERCDDSATAERISLEKEACTTGNPQAMADDGIAYPGQPIRQGDFLVGVQTPLITSEHRCKPLKHKGPVGETAVVDRVALYSDEIGRLCVNLVSRQIRRPEVGDRYGTRHGQKGVCGAIIQQEDLVFSERGICPDLIMNPHGFYSPSTVGSFMEILGSKAGASCGRFHHGTAFGEPSGHAARMEDISEALVRHGFSYNGKDILYSGVTGSPLAAYIFMGTIYYQKLKHMVLDKMHACGHSRRDILTRQPTKGQKIDERVRDCLISYGASGLLHERLMLSSDKCETEVCRDCGLLGYYDRRLKHGFCSACQSGDNVSTIAFPYGCKLLFQELQTMNIVPRLKLADA